MIFDEKDLEIARNQPKYHFYEWAVAVHLIQAAGYLSLVEQYEFASHERKQAVLERLVPMEVRRLLVDARLKRVQCPDLFLYREDDHEWRFCEVKGPGDSLRPRQEEFFRELAGRFGESGGDVEGGSSAHITLSASGRSDSYILTGI
jgi:hypothetical protein